MKNDKKYSVPEEWLKYFSIVKDKKFLELYEKFSQNSDKEIKMNLMEEMFGLLGGLVIKKQHLDYRNSWKIDFFQKCYDNKIKENVVRDIDAYNIFVHLDLFFNEMERVKNNKTK